MAASDFPHPWMPTRRTPRGGGRPKRDASGSKARARSSIQALNPGRPPRSAAVSADSTSSSPRSRARSRFFSPAMTDAPACPSVGSRRRARVKARRAWPSERPRAATRARWRTSGATGGGFFGWARPACTASSSAESSASSGSGRRSTAASPATPSGSSRRGATMTRHRPSAPRAGSASRSFRATSGSRRARWKSRATARNGEGARTRASRNVPGSFAAGAIPSSPRCEDQTADRASKARAAASQMTTARSSSAVTR